MPIRWYVDADLKGLAKVLVQARADITYPGDPGDVGGLDGFPRPACSIHQDEKDEVWIPQVAAAGWVVLTRDRHMRHRPAEKAAIVKHAARVVRLEARQPLNKWGQLEIVASQWRRLEELADLPGPWVYSVSRTGGARREAIE